MPDFEARIEPGTASLQTKVWTDATPSPSSDVRSRRNPRPGVPETFLLASGSIGDTVEIVAVPMGNIGRHTGSNNLTWLIDANQDWVVGALIGSIVENLTDGCSGTVTGNTATSVLATLAGGTDDDWDNGDLYRLRMADTALDSRLFTFDCIEHPGTPPSVSQASGWSAEATVSLMASGHYTFTWKRAGGGGGLIMHLDAEVT